MKKIIILSIYFSLLLIACDGKKDTVTDNKQAETDSLRFKNGYADVNGIKMYRLIPHSRLAFFPGIHGAYIIAEESISSEDDKSTRPLATEVIERFLDEPYP